MAAPKLDMAVHGVVTSGPDRAGDEHRTRTRVRSTEQLIGRGSAAPLRLVPVAMTKIRCRAELIFTVNDHQVFLCWVNQQRQRPALGWRRSNWVRLYVILSPDPYAGVIDVPKACKRHWHGDRGLLPISGDRKFVTRCPRCPGWA